MARPAAIEGTVRADLFRLLRRTAELVVPPVRRVSKVRDDPARTEKNHEVTVFAKRRA